MRWPNGSQTQPNVSSAFGPRGPGVGSSVHKGVDFTGVGQVRAIADGQVVAVGVPKGWSAGGIQVWVQHAGFFTRSMHLGGYSVSVGQWVSESQILGSQDTTGTATGSHLHLEVTLGNWHSSNVGQIDPVPFIRGRITGSPAGGASNSTLQLQIDLTTAGWPTKADGDYGPATKQQVSNFQAANGLVVDGQAGPATFAKLKEVITGIQEQLIKLGYVLGKDGLGGPATTGAIKDFQSKNGLEADGSVGPNTAAALAAKSSEQIGYNAIPDVRSIAEIQKRVGADPDGIYGATTTRLVKTLQHGFGLLEDGIWGPATDAAAFPPTPAAFIPFPVTGVWDAPTIRALQASFGFTGEDIDGDRGPQTIKAQQIATGMPVADQDGEDGPLTTRYLQASLGVRQDGQQGPDTLKALQTLLNAGRKLIPGKLEEVEAPTPHPKPAAPTYPRATRWDWTVNSSPREGKVTIGIIHHWGIWPAPSPDSLWNTFMNPNGRSVSPGVQINPDGSVFEPVPQDTNRPWTTGEIDHVAITAEIGNGSGPEGTPPWGFTAAALEEAAHYIAWGHTHYGIPVQKGQVGPGNVIVTPGWVGHNETPAGKSTGTTCPGSFPWESVLARALEILQPETPPEPPADWRKVKVSWLEDLEANALDIAAETRKQIDQPV